MTLPETYQMTFTKKRSTETLTKTRLLDDSEMHKRLLSYMADRDEWAYYGRQARTNVGDAAIQGATLRMYLRPYPTCQFTVEGYNNQGTTSTFNAESADKVKYFETNVDGRDRKPVMP